MRNYAFTRFFCSSEVFLQFLLFFKNKLSIFYQTAGPVCGGGGLPAFNMFIAHFVDLMSNDPFMMPVMVTKP